MILGVGIDMCDVAFWRDALNDPATSVIEGTFTPSEQLDCQLGPVPAEERYAARFAAKEATIKALSGGRWNQSPIVERIQLLEIEVKRDNWGRPSIELHGAARDVATHLGVDSIHLSISHESSHAVAVTVLESH